MRWNSNLAYAVGLITTDGNLSKDGRHLDFTSKDRDLIVVFAGILGLNNKISLKKSTFNKSGIYYHIQFGNVKLYRFLLEIGLIPNKSKTIGPLLIPEKYFRDFLRGCLDGDGYTYSYWDKRWKNSFQIYTGFVSASPIFLEWLCSRIETAWKCKGRISFVARAYKLEYAKKESRILLKQIYYKEYLPCLLRKRSKIEKSLSIISKQ